MTLPRATVRLQLHAGFTLADALEQVDYYAELGVSHYYLSPVTCARPGSTHGYDVVDHARVNPELGGEPALHTLAEALHARGMGLIVDIVPNHMAVHWDNAWWRDVLTHGPRSAHARWFDIDWQDPDPWLRGRVLAPTLGRPYDEALAGGDIRLAYDDEQQAFHIEAGGRYPLAPGTLRAVSGEPQATLRAHDPATPEGLACLEALLALQHYRLAWWPSAAEQINWRRFFEIGELVGVRVDLPDVFEAVHALVLRLYAEGVIDGVRVDHVDGLAEPGPYCRRLRAALRRAAAGAGRKAAEPYIVVEKILHEDETLPASWQVDGSTGYDFMDDASAVLHAAEGEAALVRAWQRLGGDARPVAEQLEAARHLMLTRHFMAETRALVRVLGRLARLEPGSRDRGPVAVERALLPWLMAFPVYRTYGEDRQADLAVCREAAQRARRIALQCPDSADDGGRLLGQLLQWLTEDPGLGASPEAVRLRRQAQRRLRHLTPPLAAKALEDTLFYRYGVLLSRNEVGASPEVFALSAPRFHERVARRAQHHPGAMLATATHDHKRGEDVRARLAVLSEQPDAWVREADAIIAALGQAGHAPDVHPGDLYLMLQTVVGAWPPDLEPGNTAGVQAYRERVAEWQVKALREAKLRSSWFAPDEAYEQACLQALQRLCDTPELRAAVARWAQRLCLPGMVNGLAQVVLRLSAPGVPDLYQGTERWDFSLVDPDNRRAVDYALRRRALAETPEFPALQPDLPQAWYDGTVKQALLRTLLTLRAQRPGLMQHGSYHPLPAYGARAAHVLAYARRHADGLVAVVVPRACSMQVAPRLHGDPAADAAAWWQDTHVILAGPDDAPPAHGALRDILTGQAWQPDAAGALPLAGLLQRWPVAVLASG